MIRKNEVAGIAVFLLVSPLWAVAQPSQSQTEVSDTEAIEEIVVTATRRDTPLQDTALSVSALTAENLRDARTRQLEDYWRQVPSMAVTDTGLFGTRISVRGLAVNFGAFPGEALTAAYIDDTPVTNTAFADFSSPPDLYLVDINRVEVLRGPQGTLFGASSMGGAVRNITNKPDASSPSRLFESTLSSTNHGGENYAFTAIFNQPLVKDKSAVRLAAFYDDSDGFVDDIGFNRKNVNWRRTYGFRLSANTLIRDELRITGKLQYQDGESGGYNEVDPNGKPEIGMPTYGDYQLALLMPESGSDELLLAGLDIEYETQRATWTSVSSYFESEWSYVVDIADEMNVFFGEYLPAQIIGNASQEVLIQEFRVTGDTGERFDWLAGVFFQDQDVDGYFDIPAPGFNNAPGCVGAIPPFGAPYPTCSGFPDGEENLWFGGVEKGRKDYGVFGDLSYEFADRWEATLGARWYEFDDKGNTGYLLEGYFEGGFGPPADEAPPRIPNEDGINLNGSLSLRPNENSMVYALASQGFRSGGRNELYVVDICANAPATFDSDTLWNYEIGARTTWLGRRLTINASAFRIDWTDAQVSVFSDNCLYYYTTNSGKATSEGLELELAARINDSWDLLMSAGYTDAKLAAGLVDPDINAPAGTELPNAPDLTASLASTNRFSAFGGHEGFLRVDIQHVGRTYNMLDLNNRVKAPSYTLLNLRGGVTVGEWRTELFVENIFDEQAMLSCCRLNGEYVTNRPRTIGLRIGYGR